MQANQLFKTHNPLMDGSRVHEVAAWQIESETRAGRWYTITEKSDGSFACSCIGWTRHVPRRDCKHIWHVKTFGTEPVEPLARQVELANRAANRRKEVASV